MNIAVIGCGYVGLVTAAGLADFGHTVTGIDNDGTKISLLKRGIIPFYEKNLKPLVARGLQNKRLSFTTNIDAGIGEAEAIFIAVGTPSLKDGAADISQVLAVARSLAPYLKKYTVIINKSTVPVGTAQQVQKIIQANLTADLAFDVASNPEFLREGNSVADFYRPDRVVVGTNSPRAKRVIKKIYAPLLAKGIPFVWANPESAELIKYAANAFLAAKVTLINEIANLCEATGADIDTVSRALGLDARIGSEFLAAGPGYGGSCFPKDTKALVHLARACGEPVFIIEAVVKANERQKARMVRKIQNITGNLRGKTLALLGLAFKAGVDDLRESPAITVVNQLLAAGAKIKAHDPLALKNAEKFWGKSLVYCHDPYEAAAGAEALVIVTDWDEYRRLDLAALKKIMKAPVLIDLRNIFTPRQVQGLGFRYESVGRGLSENSPAPVKS